VSKKAKYVCLGLLFLMTAYELMLFTWSAIAEHKAEKIAELVATLKPGYTTKDGAKALFEAHGLSVSTLSNACSTPKGSCETLFVDAANFPPLFPFHLGRLGWITVLPLPPVKTTYFLVDLYFVNGVLDSFNEIFHVGATGVSFSRDAKKPAGTIFRSSEWRYGDGGMVGGIGAIYSGNISDVPAPKFAFKYMYSVKCVDARMLWPTAPPPTTELHGWPGCR
jgi:hypothetical protein